MCSRKVWILIEWLLKNKSKIQMLTKINTPFWINLIVSLHVYFDLLYKEGEWNIYIAWWTKLWNVYSIYSSISTSSNLIYNSFETLQFISWITSSNSASNLSYLIAWPECIKPRDIRDLEISDTKAHNQIILVGLWWILANTIAIAEDLRLA